MADQALAHLQVELLQIIDLVTAHGLGVKDTGFIQLPIRFEQGL